PEEERSILNINEMRYSLRSVSPGVAVPLLLAMLPGREGAFSVSEVTPERRRRAANGGPGSPLLDLFDGMKRWAVAEAPGALAQLSAMEDTELRAALTGE